MTPAPGRVGDEGKRDGTRLRLARLAHGLSQQDLATSAGVTRQAVAGVEAGQWYPSLRVALALGRALQQRVEDLFGPPSALAPIGAEPLGASDGAAVQRVDLAQVGATTVALPLAGNRGLRAGFAPAGGVVVGGTGGGAGGVVVGGTGGGAGGAVRSGTGAGATWAGRLGAGRSSWDVRPTGPLRPTLVVAGCDPALPLLAGPLSLLDPPLAFSWWPCSSRDALELAAAGLVHVAGFHVARGSAAGPTAVAAPGLASQGGEVIGFTVWDEGLAVRRGLGLPDLAGIAERRLRLVNREPGSEARELLEREMARHRLAPDQLPGFDTAAGGHLLVAAALAAGLGDVGVTTAPSALAYGLDFLPLASEQFLLALPRPVLDTSEVRGLLRVLASAGLQEQLAALPGYREIQTCGEPVSSI